jgi:predicted RecA/RadA family phage recombinase
MKNFLQPGNVVSVRAPRALKSGDGFVLGKLFGIAANDVAINLVAEAMIEGVVALKKAAGVVPNEGDAVLFDETTQTIVATGGKSIGYCVEGSAPDDATFALVKLIPTAV